ncbi:hypothetical protein BBK36DRAFT_1138177 [Trichoderma citrinoviride]|uniref:Uncharacterized protein n=1 Tax=Trichoderma citrinoviride TaxID=58853 RepID=A0A2T4BKG3_9HYPO|nr:hypothetical protein BBK36DRAFT_1138177 [Trichoderma citrinoviride]PTB69759.1 hypothetical protein BBK36DRAFT_1138177 [Trichoderma citrinoviride]
MDNAKTQENSCPKVGTILHLAQLSKPVKGAMVKLAQVSKPVQENGEKDGDEDAEDAHLPRLSRLGDPWQRSSRHEIREFSADGAVISLLVDLLKPLLSVPDYIAMGQGDHLHNQVHMEAKRVETGSDGKGREEAMAVAGANTEEQRRPNQRRWSSATIRAWRTLRDDD